MGISYAPDNPFAPKKKTTGTYSPDNPFAAPEKPLLTPAGPKSTTPLADRMTTSLRRLNVPTTPEFALSDPLNRPIRPGEKGGADVGVNEALMGVASLSPLGLAALPFVVPKLLKTAGGYVGQKAAERSLPADVRTIAEQDPERIPGGEAAMAGGMLAAPLLIHAGMKGFKTAKAATDVSGGMMEAGAQGVKDMPLGPDFNPDTPPSPGENTYLNKRFAAKLRAGSLRQGAGRDVAPVEGLQPSVEDAARLNSVPRKPQGYSADNPFAPENIKVKPLETETPADVFEATAEAKNDPMRPRRRVAGAPPEPVPAPVPEPVAAEPVPAQADPLPSYPEGFSAGSDLNAPSRIPKLRTVKGNGIPVPEGATTETQQAALDLAPNRYHGHSDEALDTALLDTQKAIEDAQAAQIAARQRGLVGEAAQADMENRGVSYSDESEMASKTADKQLAAAKARLNQIERQYALRGVSGDALAERMQAAKELRMEREGMQQGETPTDDPFAGPSTAAEPSRGLAPVEGMGETVPRGTSLHMEDRAIADGLAESLGDLPEYKRVNFADQTGKARALLASNPELARQIATGNADAPDGLIPEIMMKVMERQARETGDVELLRDLAHGKLAEEGTTMGQRIAAHGARDPESPVDAMQVILSERQKYVAVGRQQWKDFLNGMKC